MRGDTEPFNAVVDRYSRLLKSRDPQEIAIDIFHQLESLRPVDVAMFVYRNPEEQRAYDKLTSSGEYPPPRTDAQRACDRSAANSENARRLRTTMWAEVTLRGGRTESYAKVLAAFHREQWRIALVSADMAEREKQIEQHVAMKARER